MMNGLRHIGFWIVAALALTAYAEQASAAPATPARFEVTSSAAVRPTLVNTIAALQQHDAARAKAAFESYDSAWNGIEVYISTRSKDLYDALEHNYQARIE